MYFDPVTCGQRIKELRQLSGMTQEEFAVSLNVSRDSIGKLELGKRTVSIDLMIDISAYFNVSLDSLILGKCTSSFDTGKALQDAINLLIQVKIHL